MLRVNNGVLVVPPFECAWLTGDAYTLQSGSGCLSFEAKGDTDVTVILKSTPGAKRLQPLLRQALGHAPGHAGGGNALQVEQNYTIIFGSHQNSCLKIEKNGVTQCMVTGVACSRVSSKSFSKYWIDLNHGVLTVGHGEPGQGVCQQWRDTQEIPGIQHIGLSCWDRHVSYRAIALQPPLDFTRLQQAQLGGAEASAVPSLFDGTCSAIMAATSPANVCRTLHVAELLLPTTQKLYRYCLDYIARHFETVVRLPAPAEQLRRVSSAAMCDLVCQNTFSVDEQGIYAAVRDWACSHVASSVAEWTPPDSDVGGGVDGGDDGCKADAAAVEGTLRRLPALSAAACQPLPPSCGCPPWHRAAPPGGNASFSNPQRTRVSEPGAGGAAAAASSPGWNGAPAGPPADGGSFRSCSSASQVDLPSALATATPLAPGTPIAAAFAGAGNSPGILTDWQPLQPCRSAEGAPGKEESAALGPACWLGPGGCLSGAACAEEAASRVLSLIRFPLLPIDQLHACLDDPLLTRLPAVLELVYEALEVHRRETGAGLADGRGLAGGGGYHHGHGGSAAGGGGGGGNGSSAATRSASLPAPASERRLVKPLPSVPSAGGGGDAGGGAAPPAASSPSAASAGSHGVTAAGGGAGGAGAPTGGVPPAGDSCWSVRYQRRCLPFALELMYVCDGDSCGVLHFLGTQYGSQGWVNPMLAKRVDLRASSPTGRTTDPRVVVGRQFVRTNFAGPRYVNGAASSWWQVDLGEQHQLAITYYSLRHDGSPDFARSWVLQGSHDLLTWADLKRHANDTTIKVPGQYASWPVIGPAAAVPYRAFRLLLTGPTASPNAGSRFNFCLSNLELYGFLHKGTSSSNGGFGAGSGSSPLADADAAAPADASAVVFGAPAGGGAAKGQQLPQQALQLAAAATTTTAAEGGADLSAARAAGLAGAAPLGASGA